MLSSPLSASIQRFFLSCTVAVVTLMAGFGALAISPAHAQSPASGSDHGTVRLPLEGLPDLVLPRMSPARGRVYFATRACVVCHSVNNVGGALAPALDYNDNGKAIDMMSFVSRMWRGARDMVALQDALFGEPLDLAPDELADIIAFLYSPEEKKKFSEKDIPKFIRDFMAARTGPGRK